MKINICETLRSRADAPGHLQLDILTALPNTELEVLVFLRPVNARDDQVFSN